MYDFIVENLCFVLYKFINYDDFLIINEIFLLNLLLDICNIILV